MIYQPMRSITEKSPSFLRIFPDGILIREIFFIPTQDCWNEREILSMRKRKKLPLLVCPLSKLLKEILPGTLRQILWVLPTGIYFLTVKSFIKADVRQ